MSDEQVCQLEQPALQVVRHCDVFQEPVHGYAAALHCNVHTILGHAGPASSIRQAAPCGRMRGTCAGGLRCCSWPPGRGARGTACASWGGTPGPGTADSSSAAATPAPAVGQTRFEAAGLSGGRCKRRSVPDHQPTASTPLVHGGNGACELSQLELTNAASLTTHTTAAH